MLKFEELIAWQKARIFVKKIYRITHTRDFRRDWGLSSQIQRSAVSIMSNIAEGHEKRGPKEYLRFLNIAQASCAEARSLLYVALDADYIGDGEFMILEADAEEVSRILAGLTRSIHQRKEVNTASRHSPSPFPLLPIPCHDR